MNKKEMIIKELEKKIRKAIMKLDGIPEYLIPKINVPNDYAYPYVEIENNGTIYIVVREKGVEYERVICLDVSDTILKLFEKITFELAVNEEKNNLKYSIENLKNKQKELMKLIILNDQ